MIIKYLKRCSIQFLIIFWGLLLFDSEQLFAQVSGPIPQQIRWLTVNAIRQWVSNAFEIEYGRRGRAGFESTDQLDGLAWPQDYNNQDASVGKSLWIGTTNFEDPVSGLTYAYKVVTAGRVSMNLGPDIIPEYIKLIGDRKHPTVLVDDLRGSKIESSDVVDEIDATLPCDRIAENVFHTSVGITVKRRILAFSQQYHNNYFITEYEFTNTGVIDQTGIQKLNKTLTDVVFHWQYRYGFAGEAYHEGWAPTGASWGLNTINDVSRVDNGGEFRAIWSYYGPVSTSPGLQEDIGLPHHTVGDILAGTNFAGVVVLHADTSPTDRTDNPLQPFSTKLQPSDRGAQGVDQYDPVLMTRKYTEFMAGGHDALTHAQQIGMDANGWPTAFANTWGGDAGGYAATQGFGPYTLEQGQSIRIIVAEAVAGIMKDRERVREVANNWFDQTGNYVLPNGSTTTDRNIYKNTWVFTGKDSLFQTFRRAIANYNSGYNIPKPPPPPDQFTVQSGGNKITLTWSNSAESWPNFDGYRLYRAEGRLDTTYQLIFFCNKNNAVDQFEDVTARRGFSYFYYIQTKDDGSTNDLQPGVPLVSSKYYTNSILDAFLTRPPEKNLSKFRIVPNPYNIKARDLQFGQSAPDRIAFFGLPPVCTIKIFTETGGLVETIEHTNGSGDELWHSLTSSGQIVASGLYIAYLEVTEDTFDDETGELLFRKGDNTFEKFIIIR